MDILINAEVTSPDGFYYREEHEWKKVPIEFADWLKQEAAKATTLAAKLASQGNGKLTAKLGMTVDGTVQDPMVVTGITYVDLVKFQRATLKSFGDVLEMAEKNAKRKV